VTSTPLHVVFGAGQLGTSLALHLLAQGARVRVARRSGSAPAGAELVLGDASDRRFARLASEGATVIHHAVNPPYFAKVWAREIPRINDSLVAAAGATGARLVVMDNLYMYGRPNGKPLSENSPIAPVSHKGEIRARAAEQLLEAHRAGTARVVLARASDYYGPRATSSHLGDSLWPKALSKGVAPIVVRPDTPHTYHYLPDVAAALVQLAEAPDDVTGRVWMLPAAPADTTAGMIARLGRALGRELRIERVPRIALRSLGVFMPLLRELAEMGYMWEEPFVVDDRAFRARFPAVVATPLDTGAAATVEWARHHYAASR
jgi:nucleoside-diphosphate-sugar epimerase